MISQKINWGVWWEIIHFLCPSLLSEILLQGKTIIFPNYFSSSYQTEPYLFKLSTFIYTQNTYMYIHTYTHIYMPNIY